MSLKTENPTSVVASASASASDVVVEVDDFLSEIPDSATAIAERKKKNKQFWDERNNVTIQAFKLALPIYKKDLQTAIRFAIVEWTKCRSDEKSGLPICIDTRFLSNIYTVMVDGQYVGVEAITCHYGLWKYNHVWHTTMVNRACQHDPNCFYKIGVGHVFKDLQRQLAKNRHWALVDTQDFGEDPTIVIDSLVYYLARLDICKYDISRLNHNQSDIVDAYQICGSKKYIKLIECGGVNRYVARLNGLHIPEDILVPNWSSLIEPGELDTSDASIFLRKS